MSSEYYLKTIKHSSDCCKRTLCDIGIVLMVFSAPVKLRQHFCTLLNVSHLTCENVGSIIVVAWKYKNEEKRICKHSLKSSL